MQFNGGTIAILFCSAQQRQLQNDDDAADDDNAVSLSAAQKVHSNAVLANEMAFFV